MVQIDWIDSRRAKAPGLNSDSVLILNPKSVVWIRFWYMSEIGWELLRLQCFTKFGRAGKFPNSRFAQSASCTFGREL